MSYKRTIEHKKGTKFPVFEHKDFKNQYNKYLECQSRVHLGNPLTQVKSVYYAPNSQTTFSNHLVPKGEKIREMQKNIRFSLGHIAG